MKNAEPLLTLLAIDDDPAVLELISAALEQEGLEILTASDAEAGLRTALKRRPQVILLDLMMPGVGGMELLERLVEADPGAEVILLTGHISTETAVEAIQKGAADYLTKPVSVEKLRQRIGKLLSLAEKKQRNVQLERELIDAYQFEGIVGRSPQMLEVFDRVRRIAPHFRTALVTGPTGTGKELIAQALHRLSPAAKGPFVVCNCSAIVETLFESELFGHVKGAFTGAVADRKGLFEAAHGGTIFLDEIGELPPAVQAKLLRVLQSHEIQRVGSPAARQVDVRVVAATNRDLAAMAAEKQFREDLYYRLSAVQVTLPPLAERASDLPLLVRHFLERSSQQYGKPIRGLTRRAQLLLARCRWPGNVRELENVLAHAAMMAQGEVIDVADLPEQLRRQAARPAGDSDVLVPLEEMERRHVLRVLEHVGGNKKRAAEILGVSRATLYRFISDAADGPQG
jgi:DNA-binding NtrC family response regulator